ncbi:MAG: hypothetical protein E5X80_29560 [Mesorhizobium sp.]|uniref:hypothetical protein n=1 Tax=Mesorhizobium sp. TaxID=1871066 RepID=UPI000FE48EFC|nr:hypothetical protein [Mesorhizobium sp.]RWM00616.1 MAG: hypothetical protein EOR71_30040 [Mesorhizobium sp.]TIO47986.1 MAG: hypothetical protein E5X78_30880 [Mesorhizobium sp.]TIO56401.1 MAG: hypothetical protein E5X79_30770 [Mesorhizobium sp.]TJV57638.1 MAG: hypothetical protein E5X80_29560 [Mesorhizobium sp.]
MKVWPDNQRPAVYSFIASYALASFATGLLLMFGSLVASGGQWGFPDDALGWLIVPVVYLYGVVCFSFLIGMFTAIPATALILALRFAELTGPISHALAGAAAAFVSVAGVNSLILFHRDNHDDWPIVAAGAAAGLVYWFAFERIRVTLARREPPRPAQPQ